MEHICWKFKLILEIYDDELIDVQSYKIDNEYSISQWNVILIW